MCLDLPLPGVDDSLVNAPPDYQILDDGAHSIVTAEGSLNLTDEEAEMEHVHKELLMVALVLRSQAEQLRNRIVGYVCLWMPSQRSHTSATGVVRPYSCLAS